ncbi:PREDICTED: mucosal addressin cell adhesion molecule 1 [Myotis brandtii]|uniref:mucosal addressin cell adhesion molecule 1 n=1 Tax=Myotis brandtii TaxID=109478 RepID=UPI0007044298|nr:PREDICTED: mucosal addressin cell adhesion molecule 1 [Myotis brandtii]
MEPGLAFLLPLFMGLLQPGRGDSVLSVRNASLSSAGTRVCVGSCGNLTYQHTVRLLVFAFPNQLTVSPVDLVAGRDQELACTAHNITPASPDVLSLSLLLGDQELEGVQELGLEDEEPQEGEDPLFQVTKRWLLPPLGTPPLTLHCQATMRLPGLELSHRKPIPVLHSLTSQETRVTTSLEAILEQNSTPSPRGPGNSPTPGNSSTRPCHPEIHQSPTPGGLELLCEAACGPGTAVHWTRAPGDLAAYKRREDGAQAWLSVLWAGCNPEGWFQCRLDPGGHTASLYLLPEICSPPMSEALWMGSLVLGLLLLTVLTYRLWKCCQPARGPQGPPAPLKWPTFPSTPL